MGKIVGKDSDNVSFDVIDSNEDEIVFQQKAARKGKRGKNIKRIKQRVPTLTVRYFDQNDFDNLKRIEAEIHSNINISYKSSIAHYLNKFFEIK